LAASGEGFVARVTLIRPERRNALNVMPLLALEKASSDLRQAVGVGVVVPSGAGGSFCAGVDMEDVRREFYEPPQQVERLYQENGQEVVGGFQSLPQVTIAEVNGPAIAWGTCLAISCDFRVVSAEARSRGLEDGVVSPAGLAAETLRLAAALGVRDGIALRIAKRQCELRRALRNVTLDWGGWN